MRETPPARSRAARNLRRGAIVLAVLVAIVYVVHMVVLPSVARSRIDALLREAGVRNPQYTLDRVSLRSLSVSNVRLGDDPWLTAGGVRVRYDPILLLTGRLQDIDVVGATYRVAVTDGIIDWGPRLPPRSRGDAPPDPFNFDTVRLSDCRVVVDVDGRRIDAAIDGSLVAIEGNALRADLQASLLGQPLDVRGVVMTPGLQVRAEVAEFALTDARTLAQVVPGLGEVAISGRFALDLDMRIDDGEVTPLLKVRATDAMVAHPDWPLAIGSASGVFTFDSFAPLRTRGVQRIDIDRALTGEIDITDAAIDLTMQSPDSFFIESARWVLEDGGRVHASPFALDLRLPRIATTIACENLDLDFWLRTLSQGRADGQGRLRGDIAVAWDPNAYPRIQFAAGKLVAAPPTGFIRTHDAQRLGELLDQSDPQFTIDERLAVVKERIIEALRDLGFTSLTLEFLPSGADTTLRAEIKGKGRRGQRPQEFAGLVINIGHFAERFQTVLNARNAYESLRSRSEGE